ncbi:MAG: MATE family efflux transporter [Gammaproteobacteria bacterium]
MWLASRDEYRRILALALPIVGGMISQAIMNVVDAALVGILGAEALAGVGVGGYAVFFVSSLVMGLGSGVQAVAGRRFGEGKTRDCAHGLHAGLLIALVLSVVLIPLVYTLSSPLMLLMNKDPNVQHAAIPYLQIRTLSILAIGLNFSFRGFLNAINLSHIYMRTLICMHVLNGLLSYLLIFGKWGFPEMGVAGAAWGTTLSMYLGSILYAHSTWQYAKQHGFLKVRLTRQSLNTVFHLAMPNSIQSLFFSAGLIMLFWIIGHIGSAEVAVAHALVTLMLFMILPAMGIGMAAATLVSQALGQGEPEEAYWWAWRTSMVCIAILFIPGLLLITVPDAVLSLFFHKPALIELGRTPLQLTGWMVGVEAIVMILPQALLGAGASQVVMRITVLSQWGMFLPLAWAIGPWGGHGLWAIWILHSVYRLMTAIIFAYYWIRKDWQRIHV